MDEKTLSLEDVLKILSKMRRDEVDACETFCAWNEGNKTAIEERKKVMLYALDTINVIECNVRAKSRRNKNNAYVLA